MANYDRFTLVIEVREDGKLYLVEENLPASIDYDRNAPISLVFHGETMIDMVIPTPCQRPINDCMDCDLMCLDESIKRVDHICTQCGIVMNPCERVNTIGNLCKTCSDRPVLICKECGKEYQEEAGCDPNCCFDCSMPF